MVNQQLLDYIKQQLQQGISKEQIKSSLVTNGWQAQDIDEAFSFISNPTSQSSPVPPPAQTISSLPGATAIFGQAWAIYKQRLGTFLGVMAIPMLIMIVLLAIVAGGGLLGVSLLSSKFAAGGIGLLILLAILFLVIIFISQAWGQTALLYAIKDSQERIGVIESYRRGWHKIFSYWWVTLLAGFITMGGFLLLIVPGIIFAVWFSLAMFILIAEDLKGMNALLKSREYVKGKWGGIFWRFFFIGAISLIISLVPILIFSLLKIPFGSEISRFVIGLFLTPLVMTYSFLVYSNLKALKGEVAFVPTGGKKAVFIFVGILGILLIPAILFSTVFLSLGSAREKARDARRQADIRQIQMGLEIFYSEQNKYPFSLNELSPKYLSSAPVDPSTNQPYQYQLQPNGTDYQVCAQLESTKTQKCVTSQF
jgi:Tfp pilus assembly protein PilE